MKTQNILYLISGVLFFLVLLLLSMQFVYSQDYDLWEKKKPTKPALLIGNSLTRDVEPRAISLDAVHHIQCGANLMQIYQNPSICDVESTIWTEAIHSSRYDNLTFQPFNGTNMKEDIDVITRLSNMRPEARIVIHEGWSTRDRVISDYEADLGDCDHMDQCFMIHNPEYFDLLEYWLSRQFPYRDVVSTNTTDMIYFISQDNPVMFDLLWRDDYHMSLGLGRFLIHNAMRQALELPFNTSFSDGTPYQLTKDEKDYLLGVVLMFEGQ